MYTAKRVSSVKSAFCPSASRRSAQWAYASKSSRRATRSAASVGVISVCRAIGGSSSESDEVDAGERVVDRLHEQLGRRKLEAQRGHALASQCISVGDAERLGCRDIDRL